MSGYLSILLFEIFLVLLCYQMFRKRERTHDEARLVVCAACGEKDFLARPVTPALEEIIREEIDRGYNRSDSCPSRSTPCQCRICKKVRYHGKSFDGGDEPDVPRKAFFSKSYNCILTVYHSFSLSL